MNDYFLRKIETPEQAKAFALHHHEERDVLIKRIIIIENELFALKEKWGISLPADAPYNPS